MMILMLFSVTLFAMHSKQSAIIAQEVALRNRMMASSYAQQMKSSEEEPDKGVLKNSVINFLPCSDRYVGPREDRSAANLQTIFSGMRMCYRVKLSTDVKDRCSVKKAQIFLDSEKIPKERVDSFAVRDFVHVFFWPPDETLDGERSLTIQLEYFEENKKGRLKTVFVTVWQETAFARPTFFTSLLPLRLKKHRKKAMEH